MLGMKGGGFGSGLKGLGWGMRVLFVCCLFTREEGDKSYSVVYFVGYLSRGNRSQGELVSKIATKGVKLMVHVLNAAAAKIRRKHFSDPRTFPLR